MNKDSFVHLHVHTEYSLLDGACKVKRLVAKAAEYGMPALAITDHGNMFGAIAFYQACVAANIKPIIGVEAYVANIGSRFDKTPREKGSVGHLVLLAKNEKGYHNLLKLVSAGYLEGFYYYPRLDKELLAQHCEGLIALSACLKGEVATHLSDGNYTAALKAADDLRQIFGKDNFFLEVMDHNLPEQKAVNPQLLKVSNELHIPLVATNDVHYLNQNEAPAHEALLCIQTQTVLSDPNRMRMRTDQFYFKTPQEMRAAFSWAPEAIENTVRIAERCDLHFSFDAIHLPRFDPPDNKKKESYLQELCEQELPRRYTTVTKELTERLHFELKVIQKMGFVSYFLIVWDFIHYAKSQGIPVGPGRGSAAGSIVSYLLGITDLDPIKYGLLFERFLNPERSGMPDIDIDFCYERRGEVIDYVTNKYGKDNVAQIITFGTMQARAAIRDVGRVMSVPYADVDKIAKLIPAELGITLEDALEKEPQLKKLCAENETARNIIKTAQVLEGLNRHASIHAAGVVISDKPLTEYVPLFKTSDGQITTAFTMKDIATIGLLKMDFLGLRTLTVIDEAVKLIARRHGVILDMSTVVLDDKKTYELLSAANSFGIFQLESAGMRDLLRKIKPTEFEDIIAILALYRPGPMGSGMLDDFIKRKRREVSFEYDHPKLAPILKETYGIIVYQEQVMKIPVALAGFSMTEADHLRRAMSKKIASVMEKIRKDFVKGCWKHSQIQEDAANRLFDLIDYFSGYGFNRSHSAAYALVSYRTAYLKANYPVDFMCALLNSEQNNTDKVVEYVRECEAMGITVLPPDINASDKDFSVVDDVTIRFGLLAVKNIGSTAIDSLVEGREKGGKYTSLFDICERVDLRLVNKKVVESLIKCGAVDSFGARRSQLMSVVERALELGAKGQKEKASGQVSFFDMFGGTDSGFGAAAQALPDIKEWPPNELLAFEKEVLGFYISGHPLSHYKVEISEFTETATKDLKRAVDGENVKLVGLIEQVKLTNTKRTNERMAILRVEDLDGAVEAVVFPSAYVKLVEYIAEGAVVFMSGKVSFRDESPKIIVEDMKRIQDVYNAIKAIKIDLIGLEPALMSSLQERLKQYPGEIPVYLTVSANNHKSVQIMVGKDFFVAPSELLMNEIKELVGKDRFSLALQ